MTALAERGNRVTDVSALVGPGALRWPQFRGERAEDYLPLGDECTLTDLEHGGRR